MKIKWTKNLMGQDEASYGGDFVTMWFSVVDLDDFKTGYVGICCQKCVTKKYKTKAACKKAVERFLKETGK